MLGRVQDVPLQIDTFTVAKIQTKICTDGRRERWNHYNQLFPL